MNKGKRRIVLIALSAICVVAAIILSIMLSGREQKEGVARIGFIMSGGIDEDGWNGMHYNGIRVACDNLDVELLIRENIKEFTGECKQAIRELAEQEVGMIILSSYGYSEEVKELVKEYPNIVFYVNSSEHHDVNMTSYFARMYQARYLSGIVAGMKTQSNQIGYVAAMANNEVNRGLNAFTLGVKRVNPDAEVVVCWTGDWDNKEKEIVAVDRLIDDENVDVFAYHQNQPNVAYEADEKGVYSIGYHQAAENCSSKYLTAVVCDWKLVYEQVLREFLVGKGNVKDNYWIGLEAEAVGLSAYSEEITPDIIEEMEEAKAEILAGKDVFSGVIYDMEGILRCDEKEFISDEVLLEQMDWYVEGVRIYER